MLQLAGILGYHAERESPNDHTLAGMLPSSRYLAKTARLLILNIIALDTHSLESRDPP